VFPRTSGKERDLEQILTVLLDAEDPNHGVHERKVHAELFVALQGARRSPENVDEWCVRSTAQDLLRVVDVAGCVEEGPTERLERIRLGGIVLRN
jgi:hypothetical protein